MDTIRELFQLLKSRNKLWQLPLIIMVCGIGGLLVLAQGSVFAPFIYSLF